MNSLYDIADTMTNETPTHDSLKTTPHARGMRIKTLRLMTSLSRRLFRERYGIPPTSLQNWEDAKGNGLTEKAARKIIQLLKPDGILCSFEWLMYGVGAAPQVTDKFYFGEKNLVSEIKNECESEIEKISRELLLFHQHHVTALDYIVSDNTMSPRFIAGEYVAGCKHHGAAIKNCVGYDCIVQLIDGSILLRTIKNFTAENKYTLTCTNSNSEIDKPVLYDMELLCAAPIIWARRKQA